jgi:hypothetical protein
MASARDKFRRGDRVLMAEDCPTTRDGKRRLGTVIGFGHRPELVTVLLDGTVTRHSYHMRFWERVLESQQSDHAVDPQAADTGKPDTRV